MTTTTGIASATIGPAHPGDAATLSEIAWASKRVWGYPDDWMAKWRAALEITSAYVSTNRVFRADVNGAAAGFGALVGEGARWDLDHLWVRPEFIRRGIGAMLFRHAVSHLQARGSNTILGIESEPNAEGFYVRMGAQRMSTIVRNWDGLRRALPYLEFHVAVTDRHGG